MNRSQQTGRYRSGQTGQTVNLLALRLRWFESSPAQFPNGPVACAAPSARRSIGGERKSVESGLYSTYVVATRVA
jgi:hypothetical protein